MTSPNPILPFYFAWVDEIDTTFDPHFERHDEDIFAFTLKHEEGQVPTLDLTIRNPRIGLLSPTRKVWAWLSYAPPTGSGVIPLFFGVVIGVPSNLFQELITIQFLARSPSFIEQKQKVAETMKIRPYWDPVFLDEKHRDDPDSILEGWSSLWHMDRTTLVVTASDILTGEDGTITFTEDDAFYDSVDLKIGEAPLANVQIQATVNWTQRTNGVVPGPDVNVQSYTGDTFLSDFPKPGAGLGGGWRVEFSFVTDVYKVELTPMSSYSSSWTNPNKDIQEDDVQSQSASASAPALLAPNPLIYTMTQISQSGYTNAFDDPPINRPSSYAVSGVTVPLWTLNASWTLRYDAKRDFSEYLFFDVLANTQSVLTSPTIEQNTEVITISGSNVGEPLQEVDAWTDFEGLHVPVATIIFPNDPTKPGGLTYQICVVAGTAGEVEPNFSDVPGTITIDNEVSWASMGQSPLSTEPNWSDSTPIPLGEIIYNVPKTFDAEIGDWIDNDGAGEFLLCTTPGVTNSTVSKLTYTPALTNSDEATPAPVTISYIPGPGWQPGGGFGGSDGSVGWTPLGQTPAILGIPIGGTMTDVTARSYFPSDRGLWSVEYLISKARARLRKRARAVTIGWDCPFDSSVGLSCRHNATLFDGRIPGGAATGKVVSYALSCDGDTGELKGHVEIGCSVGFGGTIPEITGTPQYTSGTGYMQPGYQRYDGAQVTLDDIGYTPPVFEGFDDGLIFPLSRLPTSGNPRGDYSGDQATQKGAIDLAAPISAALAQQQLLDQQSFTSSDGSSTGSAFTPEEAWQIVQEQLELVTHTIPYAMESNPVRWDFFIRSVTNGPFNGAYGLTVTPLEVPQGIDLLAHSE